MELGLYLMNLKKIIKLLFSLLSKHIYSKKFNIIKFKFYIILIIIYFFIINLKIIFIISTNINPYWLYDKINYIYKYSYL